MNGTMKEWSGSPAVRLAVYFVITTVVLAFLAWWYPWFQQLVLMSGALPTGTGFGATTLRSYGC